VKLHHGTIRLTDTPGGGCTFEVILFRISTEKRS